MSPGGYLVQQQRDSWGPFSSLRMLWTRHDTKQLYGMYERPPFPIKVDAPTVSDIMRETRFSDLCMFNILWGAGIGWAYVCSRPFVLLTQRLVVYHCVSHMMFASAFVLTLSQPYRRLTGFADNGLRWSTPTDKLKKFDCTSHFENNTIWGRFRIRPNQ